MTNKEKNIQLIILIIVCSVSLLASSCYANISGRIIDAETQQPIDGAVILVEWTKAQGVPGMAATELYKVSEVVSNKEGEFTVSNVHNPLVDSPRVTVYKKGYVAWNNEYIFPEYKKRLDFKWKNGLIVKLVPFKKTYSRKDHVFFLHRVTHWGEKINEAYRWEELEGEKTR